MIWLIAGNAGQGNMSDYFTKKGMWTELKTGDKRGEGKIKDQSILVAKLFE